MSTQRLRFRLNGRDRELGVAPERLLADLLREELQLTGTKVGCGVGVCGACTVLLDGVPATSCLLLAAQAEGRSVTTIEGVAADGGVSALQRAFLSEGGSQCGICTPGQILSATALLASDREPDEETIRHWMKGNICRCTGYYGIVRAVRAAAAARK